ncbi:MAG: zinc-ribbon and DUF3426 domain-containing protein [Proteobacteria bacterium]|nr:zinc-ribbon and DUF3426 domain-containing protein [Pseudomonadota bacterium]
MFTVCPKCALTLVVTAADLRVAQGYVRCGRCSSVFNALARLSEERGAAAGQTPPPLPEGDEFEIREDEAAAAAAPEPEPAPAPAPAPETAPETPAPAEAAPPADGGTVTAEALTEAELNPDEAIPEEALEFNPATTDVNQVFVEAPPDPQWAAATGSFRSLVAANQEGPAEEQPDQSEVDVEIDGNFLASILREEARPVTPAAAQAQPAAPEVPAPPPAPPTATPEPERPEARAPERPSRAVARGSRPAHPRPAQAAKALNPNSTAVPPATFERFPAVAPPPVAPAPAAAPPDPEPEADLTDAAELLGDAPPVTPPATNAGPVRAWLEDHAWHLGAVVAVLALALQMINHNRDALAASPAFNGPLSSVYGALGVHLYPHWDLKAYDVRQLGATAGDTGNGVISVRATIKNASAAAQPLPLLRVILQDRFGNRVALRDVAPVAYMSVPVPKTALMSAGQRVDAEVGFADPGTDAVSFEIDVCLPARGGVACANDVVAR